LQTQTEGCLRERKKLSRSKSGDRKRGRKLAVVDEKAKRFESDSRTLKNDKSDKATCKDYIAEP